MKENYQIYLPYQFHLRDQLVDWDPQLPHKKMKTMFLSNMSKSQRLTSTFFPTIIQIHPIVSDQAGASVSTSPQNNHLVGFCSRAFMLAHFITRYSSNSLRRKKCQKVIRRFHSLSLAKRLWNSSKVSFMALIIQIHVITSQSTCGNIFLTILALFNSVPYFNISFKRL